jgi:hypothetical protein
MTFRLRLRIREKATHRTCILHWPTTFGLWGYYETGRKVLITARAGYAEYNDRGEPVLDSWTKPEVWAIRSP